MRRRSACRSGRHYNSTSAYLCLANFYPADVTGSIGKQPLGDATAPLQFPKANRHAKRDLLIARPREPLPPLPAIEPAPEAEAGASPKKDETSAARFDCSIRSTNS